MTFFQPSIFFFSKDIKKIKKIKEKIVTETKDNNDKISK